MAWVVSTATNFSDMDSSGAFELYAWSTWWHPFWDSAPKAAKILPENPLLQPHFNHKLRTKSSESFHLTIPSVSRDLVLLISVFHIVQPEVCLPSPAPIWKVFKLQLCSWYLPCYKLVLQTWYLPLLTYCFSKHKQTEYSLVPMKEIVLWLWVSLFILATWSLFSRLVYSSHFSRLRDDTAFSLFQNAEAILFSPKPSVPGLDIVLISAQMVTKYLPEIPHTPGISVPLIQRPATVSLLQLFLTQWETHFQDSTVHPAHMKLDPHRQADL